MDTFLGQHQHALQDRFAHQIERFPRYVPYQLRDAFNDYMRQRYYDFFNKKAGELLELRRYVLEVQLDLPCDDSILSQQAMREDGGCYGFTGLMFRKPFPEVLESMFKHLGILDGVRDFEPRVQTTANGSIIFESDIREILEKARRDTKVIEQDCKAGGI